MDNIKEFLIQWGQYYIGLIIVAAYLILTIIRRPQQIKKWLVHACAEAEAWLGSGTGQLKLRQVYDAFISKYPYFSLFVSFDKFSKWVDEALVELKKWIETNENVRMALNIPVKIEAHTSDEEEK